MGVLQLASECPQAIQRERMVIACPCALQPGLHCGAVALGEVIQDVAFLVTVMATSP
jgi:hypothetical protein